MTIRNTLILAFAATVLFTVDAQAGGEQKKHPHLWIKSEFQAKSAECFVAEGFLFCPYDADMPNVVYTVTGIDDLPAVIKRRPAITQLSRQ